MVEKLTPKQKEEFQQAFDVFKDEGKEEGNIPNEKLYTIMKSLGQNIPDAELELMIKEIDTDDSGEIDIDEFLAMMASHLGLDSPDEAKDAFKCLDSELQGIVKVEDLKYIIGNIKDKLNEEQIINIFLELDPDGTGTVPLSTFKSVFCF